MYVQDGTVIILTYFMYLFKIIEHNVTGKGFKEACFASHKLICFGQSS